VSREPRAPAANDELSDLAQLRQLLSPPDQAALSSAVRDLRDPVRQRERLAADIPDCLCQAYADAPQALIQALDAPVAECLQSSVKRDPGFFGEILYPVMGPAIRRAISQAIRGLVEQINQTLEHSLTLKGLRWRLEAARSGVPFAEVVLRHTLQYRVEEVFLIQGGSGLLIQRLGREAEASGDADAVSAMLTAIRDFARDTFDRSDRGDARLETIDAGDHTLWLAHGPRAYLACAVRGAAPERLRDHLNLVVERIHAEHGDLLRHFDGDPANAGAVRPLLETCLQTEAKPQDARRFPWPFALIALLLLGAAGWLGHDQWQRQQAAAAHLAELHAAVDALATVPGIVVADWRVEDAVLAVVGLADPLAPAPARVLRDAGLDDTEFRLDLHAFESPETAIAQRRALARLQPPPGIALALTDDGVLHASGVADADWIARARLLAVTVPGVDRYDDSAVRDRDRDLHERLVARLRPPVGVDLKVSDGIARLAGAAPAAWIGSVDAAVADLPGLAGLDLGALVALEAERLQQLSDMIGRVWITFVSGTELSPLQRQRLDNLAALIAEAHDHGLVLGRPLRLRIIGRTDGTGTPEQNRLLARQRAETTAQWLAGVGHDMPPMVLEARITQAEGVRPDAELRRVEFVLEPDERGS
jgi:OOP family OmpA-OmpF porin